MKMIPMASLAITVGLFLAPAGARLEALAQNMKSASGNDKVGAMQALLTELVQNQIDMHRQMAMMHDHMMSQMSHK
jgi:hypothetical protein